MGLRHSSGDGQTWPEKGKFPLPLQMSAMYSYAIDYHVCATNRRTTAGAVMLIYCKILWNKLTVNISERIASLLCLSRDQFPWRGIYFHAKFTESRIGRRHRHITTVYTRADCFVMGSSVIISLRTLSIVFRCEDGLQSSAHVNNGFQNSRLLTIDIRLL